MDRVATFDPGCDPSPVTSRNAVLVCFERRTVLEALVDLPHHGIDGRRDTECDAPGLRTRSSHVIRKMLSDYGHLIPIAADELTAQVHLAHEMSVYAGRRAVPGVSYPACPASRTLMGHRIGRYGFEQALGSWTPFGNCEDPLFCGAGLLLRCSM